MMKSPNYRAFGEIPEKFDKLLIDTLSKEEVQHETRKYRPALILAICLVIVSCTAIAVVQSLGLIDLFGTGNVDHEEALTVIATDVVQNGGQTSVANFTVQEAFFDGTFMRFVINGNANGNAELRNAAFTDIHDNSANTVYGVQAECIIQGEDATPSLAIWENEAEVVIASNYLVKNITTDELRATVYISVTDVDGNKVDDTSIDFVVSQTAIPLVNEYTSDFSTDLVRIDKVKIEKTPMNTTLTLEYQPLLRSFSGFRILSEDGYTKKDGLPYLFGEYHEDMPSGQSSKKSIFILPVEHYANNHMDLWIENSDMALRIMLESGTVEAYDATVTSVGSDVHVELTKGVEV